MKPIEVAQFVRHQTSDCPSCGKSEFTVIESRLTGPHRRRRKRCSSCNFAQTTYEVTQQYFLESQTNLKLIQNLKLALEFPNDIHVKKQSARESISVVSCLNCSHMRDGKCGFDFPEAGDEFAEECIHFIDNDA